MSNALVMIVTGGSRGIGAGIARRAAADGFKVCVNYAKSADKAEAVVQHIHASGGSAIAVCADVSQPDEVASLFEESKRELGAVRALINNAGVSMLSPISEMNVDTIKNIIATNLLGTILCTRQATREMSTKRGGTGGVIVNISSIAAVHGGMPGDAVYAATKGGIDSFTMGVSKEVARDGIRVCGIRPGITRTDIWEGEVDAEEVERLGKNAVPLGRIGEIDEMASAVLWLCSDGASYVTGAILNVSGGREIFVAS